MEVMEDLQRKNQNGQHYITIPPPNVLIKLYKPRLFNWQINERDDCEGPQDWACRVVWPLVMKVFVTGITQNCCKWLSGTDSFNLLRNKNPIWLWHFSNLSWSPWWHRHELIEPLNRNPRTDGMLGSVGSCLFRIFHSWENEILAATTIDRVNMIFPEQGSKMLKSRLNASY